MEIRSRLSGNILKLKLKGRLDASSAEDFYSFLKLKWEEGIRKFLFSCEELEYLEAEGISVLARFENFLKNRGASSAYCAFNEECKTLLSFLGFGKTISFFEDTTRAEEYLSLIQIQDRRSGEVHRSSSVLKIKRNEPVQFYSSRSQKHVGSGGSHGVYIPEIQTVPENESPNSSSGEQPDLLNQSEGEVLLQEERSLSDVSISEKIGPAKSDSDYSAKDVLETAIQAEKIYPKRIIYCGSCNTRVRVSKPGRYQCPACQIQFDLNTMGGVRYLEKLLGSL
ncbi:STAS domain-containing protein [Leptospira sp. WS92.C1]